MEDAQSHGYLMEAEKLKALGPWQATFSDFNRSLKEILKRFSLFLHDFQGSSMFFSTILKYVQ